MARPVSAYSVVGKLLGGALHGNIAVLSESKSEERPEISTAPGDEEVSVRRPPYRDIRLTVFVVVAGHRLVARRPEHSNERLAIGAPIDPPRTVSGTKDRLIGELITVEVTVNRYVAILSPLNDAHRITAAIESEPLTARGSEDVRVGNAFAI
jgi:hypothetical protein